MSILTTMIQVAQKEVGTIKDMGWSGHTTNGLGLDWVLTNGFGLDLS